MADLLTSAATGSNTELPDAVALSDALPNPTVPGVGAYLLGWDGTQWARVDVVAGGILVARKQFLGGTYEQAAWEVGDGATSSATIGSSHPFLYNGTGFDWARSNTAGTLLASAARTATVSSADQTNYNARGVHVALNVSSAGTGSITLKIEGKDPISAGYYTLLEGAAVTTNSLNVYKVYPGITAAANAAASDVVPRTWRVTVTHNNANSITYSVAFATVL